jgi:protein-tyrosine phosphatase
VSEWFQTYGFAEVLDGLVVGAYPLDRDDVTALQRAGITRVLNLVADDEYRPGERAEVQAAYDAAGITEHRLRLIDFGHLPADQLEEAIRIVHDSLGRDGRTYLHCRAGWQRAAAVAAAAIAAREGLEVEQALEYVRQRKPTADPLPHQREDLRRWWEERAGAGAQ